MGELLPHSVCHYAFTVLSDEILREQDAQPAHPNRKSDEHLFCSTYCGAFVHREGALDGSDSHTSNSREENNARINPRPLICLRVQLVAC